MQRKKWCIFERFGIYNTFTITAHGTDSKILMKKELQQVEMQQKIKVQREEKNNDKMKKKVNSFGCTFLVEIGNACLTLFGKDLNNFPKLFW